MFDIGSSLRDARLRQGLDFPELEERTKVRPKYLRALEEERFDILPSPTYVKGFLRAYAGALGLDGQPFVDEYNSRFAVPDEDIPVHTRRMPTRQQRRAARESRVAVLALLAIAVVTALVIAAWRFGGPEREVVPGLAPSGEAGPEAGRSNGARARLVVRAARGSTWMEVRVGQRVRPTYRGTLESGQQKVFQGRRLHLVVNEPRRLRVTLNGRAVTLPAGKAFVVTARRIAPAP